jgi:single-strand DNA-binding protein
LATNDSYKNEKGDRMERTEWHNVVAWGKVADIIENYTTKGKMIALEGKLRTSSYEDKDGIKRRNTEIVLNEVLLLGEK